MSPRALLRRPFRYSFENATLWMIAINVLVFALFMLWPEVYGYFPVSLWSLAAGAVWTPLSYMFAHAGAQHLLFNMLGLFFFGSAVERGLGTKEFVLYYLLTGALSGLFSVLAYALLGAPGIPIVGASGAIFALLLAYATLFPRADILFWGIIPVRAPVLVSVYAGMEIFSELSSYAPSVAHLTHLAGFGFGWLYFLARMGVNPIRRFVGR